jgi:hypothetical protein
MDKDIAALNLSIKMLKLPRSLTIDLLGEDLAEKHKWRLEPREAISLYLVKKYGWTIEHCNAMSDDNIEIALCDELRTFPRPKKLAPVYEALEPSLEKLKKLSER